LAEVSSESSPADAGRFSNCAVPLSIILGLLGMQCGLVADGSIRYPGNPKKPSRQCKHRIPVRHAVFSIRMGAVSVEIDHSDRLSRSMASRETATSVLVYSLFGIDVNVGAAYGHRRSRQEWPFPRVSCLIPCLDHFVVPADQPSLDARGRREREDPHLTFLGRSRSASIVPPSCVLRISLHRPPGNISVHSRRLAFSPFCRGRDAGFPAPPARIRP
jgi:hypothetical protein